MTDAVEKRLVRLEELVAHQSTTIEDLSRQLADQWKLTERLRHEFKPVDQPLSGRGGSRHRLPAAAKAAALVGWPDPRTAIPFKCFQSPARP